MVPLGIVRHSSDKVLAFLSLGASEMFGSYTTTAEGAQTTRSSLGEGDICPAFKKNCFWRVSLCYKPGVFYNKLRVSKREKCFA